MTLEQSVLLLALALAGAYALPRLLPQKPPGCAGDYRSCAS